MLDKILKILKYGAEIGFPFPMAFDGKQEQPSATLLFTYLSFFMCLLSIIYTFFENSAVTPVISSTILFVICLTIYRIRRLDSVELDLDNKSIKIKGDDSQENKENK